MTDQTPGLAAGPARDRANPALELEAIRSAALARVRAEARQATIHMADLDARCQALAERLAREVPPGKALIGFDRPANLYVVSEIYQAGGHRGLLEDLIAARPDERHVVLFTGGLDAQRAFGTSRMLQVGAFPIHPDPSLGLYDRLLWLREKLHALAAQRLFLLQHPEDAIAAVAAHEIVQRYGSRTYVVHHADTVSSLASALPGATHLAIRPEQKARILAEAPDLCVYDIPLTYNPALVIPPINPEAARRIADPEPEFLGSGSFITATCGGAHKFSMEDGPLSLPAVLVQILQSTWGRHLHLGNMPEALKTAAYDALKAARIPADRLVFLGEVRSVAEALAQNRVDLFIASFPVGGGLSMSEAAYAGLPVAVHAGAADNETARYISGHGHAPDEAVVWSQPGELAEALSELRGDTGQARLAEMSVSSRRWFARSFTPGKFARRVAAILALSEGRPAMARDDARRAAIASVFDAGYYLDLYPDIAAAGIDPLQHYLAFGEEELRRPSPLFDPAHYLAQLSRGERQRAKATPLTHYLTVGEARGRRPHPLFDPDIAARSLPQGGTGRAGSVLASYLASDAPVVPHTFFDPRHYARQTATLPDGLSPLAHFLTDGAAEGLSPHPLIDPARLGNLTGRGPLAALLDYLAQGSPAAGEPSPHLLFEPAGFSRGRAEPFGPAAPNLLWAHLIEGNLSDRDPHLLISAGHVAGRLPGTFSMATTVLELAARGRLPVDSHPLVSAGHILKQVPWVASLRIGATEYFLRQGVGHNIDPHPLFSVQYYLMHSPDVQAAGVNPLTHYLTLGQFEGRRPHPSFDGNQYYERWLRHHGGGSPLLDYLGRGHALFRPTLPMDEGLRGLTADTAEELFRIAPEADSAPRMLRRALHPADGAPHPLLQTGMREVADLPAGGTPVLAACEVAVPRPSVVAQKHIAPPSGRYTAPAVTVAAHDDALILPGNDGFATADGIWRDPGLAAFDPGRMQMKEHGAVVALAGGRVLMRSFGPATDLAEGIFAGGTYSHNYFHFLIEVLPRVLIAADAAPAGVPVLADAGMPAQCLQALRLFLPDRPILQLSRHGAVRVGRLHAAGMPAIVQDVFDPSGAPVDAVRIHPAALQRLARLGAELRGASPVERLLLRRESGVRRLVNAPEIEAALVARDFTVMNFGQMSFAEQVRAAAGAEVIVGQSGAQLANMVFARPGTRIFPLYSNAPGTNYYIWSVIGAALGLEVINIAGWRLIGSATGNAPVVHENFTLPPALLTPFFPSAVKHAEAPARTGKAAAAEQLAEARQMLDRLFGCNTDADTLTGAWAVLAGPTPAGFDGDMTRLRRNLRVLLLDLDKTAIRQLLTHPFFADYGRNLRSGFSALTDFDEDETGTIADILDRLGVAPEPAGGAEEDPADVGDAAPARMPPRRPAGVRELADFDRTLALAMLYLPAWRAPLVADLEAVPAPLRTRYLDWITAPPFLFRAGEDAGFAAHVGRLLDWMADHLDPGRPAAIRKAVAPRAANLDLGTLLLIDEPLEGVRTARNRVLERIALRGGGTPRAKVRPADGSEGRRRIGILCRTFDKGPDAEAVVSYFTAADRTKYEIFAYSIGFQDRVVTRDEEFDREFDASIDHRRLLPSDPWDIREQLIADQLDVFLYANATTFGVRDLDLALYHRVAPVQVVMNSHVPLALGYPSFDAIITGQSDDPGHEVAATDQPERMVRVPGPVICYLNTLKPRPAPAFDRAALGLGKDEIVLFNAGSLSKLRHDCLATMMRATKQAPGARLLLAPYNPGWVARSQALAFNRQLHETAQEVGLDPTRITVMGELSVAEAEAALALSDLYLTPFPHGGATMTHLALIYGIPPVVLRRRSTRSIDQFLVESLGMRELLVSTPDDYVARVVELATDTGARRALAAALKEAARKPAFVASPGYSRAMMAAVETLLPPGT